MNILTCVFILLGNFHRPCIFHSVGLGHKPIWGLKNIAQNYKGNLFCCKIKRKGNRDAVNESHSYENKRNLLL